MNRSIYQRTAAALAVCLALGACAGGETVKRNSKTDIGEIAELIGCADDEVAVCIEVNCTPEQFKCAARNDVRAMFKAGEFRHR